MEQRPMRRRTTTTGSLSMATKVQRINTSGSILRLHIELNGTKPHGLAPVLVPDTITLVRLHGVIQRAFGWNPSRPVGRSCRNARRRWR